MARRPVRLATLLLGVSAVVAVVLGARPTSPPLHAASLGEVTAQTDASLPLRKVTMLGSSPEEAAGETWGAGLMGEGIGEFPTGIVSYTPAGGWSLAPTPQDHNGQPLAHLKLYREASQSSPSPLDGQMAPDGSGVLAGTIPLPGGGSSEEQQILLVRNPGDAFKATAPVPSEGEKALLKSGESLFGAKRAPLMAPLEESGEAGALVVPVGQSGSTQQQILHWHGGEWSSEPIEVPGTTKQEKEESGFQVLAIGASSPSNAWLLAKPSASSEGVALYRRSDREWKPVTPAPLEVGGEQLVVPGEPEKIQTQVLTVSSQGVWIDGERPGSKESTTIFFKTQSESALSGTVGASWCAVPTSGPACTYTLPEDLPTTAMRSFAWANTSSETPYGERVITGLPEGVSLRLEGTSFTRVLALGGSSSQVPGGAFGAAFSNPREGWLGEEGLPVHLTLQPQASRLAPWPVSFRHALLAVAPQPGVAVGALSSEAIAVGDLGEVARYEPGKGWMPESLLGPGGRHESPRLRAVAWPTPERVYAVGDQGEMWLWRGETGLWEKDPATPVNFIGNLLGIAFDPSNPSRGYAVGAGGVLLRYGKTWTQEKALPPQVAGASFTSIAFAGSEAIVTYRQLPDHSTDRYVGGLLVNSGSGWHVDESASAAAGSQAPWTVAALPDGGAAFSASGYIYERNAPGEGWQRSATPLPGGGEPGSLGLFREGGALRAVAAGTPPDYYAAEKEPQAPPDSPPTLIKPYPLLSNSAKGVLRQTASGWSDEEHELNDVTEGPGNYASYDTVYQPDPIAAVLIGPGDAQGWAIGGFVESEMHQGVLDTADVDRYPAEGTTPVGVGSSAVPVQAGQATVAIGGNAQCAATCADRAKAGIGPDVWLSAALSRASQVPGVRAFFYTGPRLSTFETKGPRVLSIDYQRELARYAQLLGGSPLPAFAATSPTDLDGAGTESTFRESFSGFPQPFGTGSQDAGLGSAGSSEEGCVSTPGCQTAYYAINSEGVGGTIRVVVLDDSSDVGATQLAWLQSELAHAAEAQEPAIVIGDADLGAQVAAHDAAAVNVLQALIGGGASAYFYDSPERNVRRRLSLPGNGGSIEAFGSGTLGYVNYQAESSGAFLGASGFLVAQVNVSKRNQANNVAPVSVKLIPNISELALEAQDGTLLRRSQVALFAALARRPRAGNRAQNGSTNFETDPYIPIPSNCVGAACEERIVPEYTFSSSRTDLGNFVTPNLASPDPRAVLQNPSTHEPTPDPESGLFCAYNAGTTIVTISAGGLSASLPVTIQAGSVREPCGTVPLKELPAQQSTVGAPAPPPPAPLGASPTPSPASSPPLVPVPPVPAATPAPPPVVHPMAVIPAPFLLPAALAPAPLAFVPPPLPTPARPTPPSGTSPVTSPIEVAEHEEEDEEATESASAQAVAYTSTEHEPSSLYILGAVLLAALAGASVKRRPRRDRRELRVAPATLTTMRRQRQYERERPGRNGVTKW